MTIFNFDAALAALENDTDGIAFLNKYKAQFEAYGADAAGAAVLQNIVDLFAAGQKQKAWQVFYGTGASWGTLGQGAAEDAANTAGMAQRWADLAAFLQECGQIAEKALITILVAGFCGV